MTKSSSTRILMDIRAFLELHSSRLNADILADKMVQDPEVFEQVWDVLMEDTYPISMRAAWSLAIFAEKKPSLMQPRISLIISAVPHIDSQSARRSLLRAMTFLSIPEKHAGFLFDFCFGIIETPSATIGNKAYAMNILYNISETEPDLKPELIALFESLLDDESSGIKACSRKFLKRLNRDISAGTTY